MKKEIIISGFWLLFSLYAAVESHRLGLSTANRPGPGFFPFLAAIGIGLIAAFRLVNALRKNLLEKDFIPVSPIETRLVTCVVLGMVAYALLLDTLGFLLCTFLLVVFYLKLIAMRPWKLTLIFAAVVALSSHVFFDVLLKAELPRGLLDWLS